MTFEVRSDLPSVDDMLQGVDNQTRTRKIAQALNKITTSARKRLADRVRAEVAFPSSYVSPNNERLAITKRATPASLSTQITARGRATSLARFVTASRGVNQPGVSVQVDPRSTEFLQRAFLVRLRRGNSPVTDSVSNLGLAVRLRPGESLRNKRTARPLARGLYLLYGPSVAQVLENNAGSGVAADTAPEIAENLSNEIVRLMELKNG